jgi:Protein of unknown function (DUF4232)
VTRRANLAWVATAVCASLAATVGPLAAPVGAMGTSGTVAPKCEPSALSASLDLTAVGSDSTAPAGAIEFKNMSTKACALQGVPQVQMVGADGQTLHLYEEAVGGSGARPVVLAPGHTGGKGALAASSVTWSELTCGVGSFSLSVRFTGWSSALVAPYGSTTDFSGTPCAPSGDQTVYVGTVGRSGH